MTYRTGSGLALLVGFSFLGCGGGSGTNGNGDGGNSIDSSTTVDAEVMPPNSKMVRLLSAPFSIPAGQEFYQCTRVNATEQLDVLKIIPVSPNGVHHEVFAVDPTKAAEGTSQADCGPIGFDWKPLFASGVNSPSLSMPPGVSLRIGNGEQMVLNLHLYNATGSTITGTAALDALVSTDPTGLEIAGVPFIGPPPIGQRIPAGLMMSDRCKLSRDTKFFAVFPHMHKHGRHIKIWAQPAGGTEQVVWDRDYDFQDQTFGSFAPMQLRAGDFIHVACTYDSGGANLELGDRTDQEMCFAISYVVPAVATLMSSPFCSCSTPLGC